MLEPRLRWTSLSTCTRKEEAQSPAFWLNKHLTARVWCIGVGSTQGLTDSHSEGRVGEHAIYICCLRFAQLSVCVVLSAVRVPFAVHSIYHLVEREGRKSS